MLKKSLIVIGSVALVAILLTLPLMLLWNWLMPVIFGLPEITFFQAMGLMMLSSILFKSTSTSS